MRRGSACSCACSCVVCVFVLGGGGGGFVCLHPESLMFPAAASVLRAHHRALCHHASRNQTQATPGTHTRTATNQTAPARGERTLVIEFSLPFIATPLTFRALKRAAFPTSSDLDDYASQRNLIYLFVYPDGFPVRQPASSLPLLLF